jgi:hypothetical protein
VRLGPSLVLIGVPFATACALRVLWRDRRPAACGIAALATAEIGGLVYQLLGAPGV